MAKKEIEKPLKKPKSNAGRPSLYTKELSSKICKELSTHSWGLRKLCLNFPEFPSFDTVNEWRHVHPEFSVLYDAAKQKQLDMIAEECRDIARKNYEETDGFYIDQQGNRRIDGGYVATQKLIVDTEKWLLAKLAPRKYGDQKDVEEIKADQDEMKAELKAQRAILDKAAKKPY